MKQTRLITDYFKLRRALLRKLGMATFALLMCTAGVATHADASDKRASREREALRRVQQQLSQVQGDMATLEQEKATLTADLDKAAASSKAVEGKAARLQRELGASKQQIASLTRELTLAKEALATTAQHLSETKTALTETSRTLQQTEAEKRNLEAIKARNALDIAACERKNGALYELGRSLMDRFEHKTCGETLAEKEPFTGLKKVETENLLEEYRDKLDDQKLIKPPGG
jgi:septal ring factor EnvC (AmiA/AmiB activator)